MHTFAINRLIPVLNELKLEYTICLVKSKLYEDGCKIIVNKELTILVQTHTEIVGNSLYETSLIKGVLEKQKLVEYSDIKHHDVEALRSYIMEVLKENGDGGKIYQQYKSHLKLGLVHADDYVVMSDDMLWFVSKNRHEAEQYVKRLKENKNSTSKLDVVIFPYDEIV